MSLDNFIPEVWSARLLENLNKNHVFVGLCNRDYEGEIKGYGDQVKINSVGRVTVGTYTKNTDITDPETLSDSQKVLLINQAKYFNFQIDSIDKAQQNPKVMDGAMAEASYALADASDQYVSGLYTEAPAGNCIGSDEAPITFTAATDAYNYLVKVAVKLDEANVTKAARWIAVPAWYHALLLLDNRFVQAGTNVADNVLRNGEVGKAAGFNVFVSNNVAKTQTTSGSGESEVTTEQFKIMAGYEKTISYAEQIVELSAYNPEKRFADALKGLHVYGAKVVRPDSLSVLTVARPTTLI